jgi:hypothetical protein
MPAGYDNVHETQRSSQEPDTSVYVDFTWVYASVTFSVVRTETEMISHEYLDPFLSYEYHIVGTCP